MLVAEREKGASFSFISFEHIPRQSVLQAAWGELCAAGNAMQVGMNTESCTAGKIFSTES